MLWNYEGMTIEGRYLGDIPVRGYVTLSRVKYGGGVSHHIILDKGFKDGNISREAGEGIILDHELVDRVLDTI